MSFRRPPTPRTTRKMVCFVRPSWGHFCLIVVRAVIAMREGRRSQPGTSIHAAGDYRSWTGSPAPMVGGMPNFNGTGAVGMVSPTNSGCRPSEQTGRPAASRKISLSRGVSAVLDNGRLHKNRLGCNERSNCSFNYRALPCPNIEPRTYFKGNTACRFSMTTCRHVAIPYHFRFGCSNRRLL